MIALVINAKKKAAEKKKTAGRPQQRTGQPPPNDELQNFLASLSGIPQTKPKPTATPPRIPAATAVKHRPAPPKRPRPERQEVVLTAVEQQQAEQPVVTMPPVQDKKVKGLAALIRGDLQNMAATRKAVVLREILGPPIALQKQ
jgi:hypothetical protein